MNRCAIFDTSQCIIVSEDLKLKFLLKQFDGKLIADTKLIRY